MKRLWGAVVVGMVLAGAARGQENPLAMPPRTADVNVSWGQLTPTPEMWFYEQERNRYEDPQQAVRRKAEIVAAQRRERIAARAWYGYSASRPSVNLTPVLGSYPATYHREPWQRHYAQPPRVSTRPAASGFNGVW